jgi:polyhydroxybutyrate depolymerase
MIYATGLSNGAMMSYRVACELSDKIAAIAPLSAVMMVENCQPKRPVSVIHFHGTGDPAEPYNGGVGSLRPDNFTSVPDNIAKWVKIDKCPDQTRITYQKGQATCETHGPCSQETEVTLCTIKGMGHTWPGGTRMLPRRIVGEMSYDISANDVMWEFFLRHPME